MTSPAVLYIAGWGRSGSTLLEELLAGSTGAFAAGEAERFWDASFERRTCQCGNPVRACIFWSDVLARVALRSDRAEVRKARSRILRYRHVPRALLGVRPVSGDAWSVAVAGQRALYESVLAVAGTTAMIDSSKSPVLPFFGRRLEPRLDMGVIHLVRHPAAVAYSWRRPKPGLLHSYGTVGSAANWSLRNLVAGLAHGSAFVRLRYEDLADDPEHTVAVCAEKLGISSCHGGGGVETGHAVAGNPSRMSRSTIVKDERWRTGMSSWDFARIAFVTWPLALRYGYLPWR